MQFLFDTDGFALYELEERDCLNKKDEERRPGQIILFPSCVKPCLGYEVACLRDAEEAVDLAAQITQRQRGIGISYMLRTSNGAMEDSKARREARLRKRRRA